MNIFKKLINILSLEFITNKHNLRLRKLEQLKRNEIDAASGFNPVPLKDNEELDIFKSTKQLSIQRQYLKETLEREKTKKYTKTEIAKEKEINAHLNKAADFRSEQLKVVMEMANLKLMQVMLSFFLIFIVFTVLAFLFPFLGMYIKVEYYSTVAQILPVLLIACFFSGDEEEATWRNFWQFAQNKST